MKITFPFFQNQTFLSFLLILQLKEAPVLTFITEKYTSPNFLIILGNIFYFYYFVLIGHEYLNTPLCKQTFKKHIHLFT